MKKNLFGGNNLCCMLMPMHRHVIPIAM
jgi:hypothetical protein